MQRVEIYLVFWTNTFGTVTFEKHCDEREQLQVDEGAASAVYNRACCHEATFSKTLAGVFFWCLFMYRNGTKNLKNLGRRFHEWKLV